MSVHIFAFPVVIVENVGCFEGENFGDAYHFAKIMFWLEVGSGKLEVKKSSQKNLEGFHLTIKIMEMRFETLRFERQIALSY